MTGFGGRGVQHLSLQISPKCRPPPCHPVGCLSRPKNNYLYQKFFDVLDLIRGAHPAHSTHTHVRVRIVLSIGEQNILCSREYVPHHSLAVCVVIAISNNIATRIYVSLTLGQPNVIQTGGVCVCSRSLANQREEKKIKSLKNIFFLIKTN